MPPYSLRPPPSGVQSIRQGTDHIAVTDDEVHTNRKGETTNPRVPLLRWGQTTPSLEYVRDRDKKTQIRVNTLQDGETTISREISKTPPTGESVGGPKGGRHPLPGQDPPKRRPLLRVRHTSMSMLKIKPVTN